MLGTFHNRDLKKTNSHLGNGALWYLTEPNAHLICVLHNNSDINIAHMSSFFERPRTYHAHCGKSHGSDRVKVSDTTDGGKT